MDDFKFKIREISPFLGYKQYHFLTFTKKY